MEDMPSAVCGYMKKRKLDTSMNIMSKYNSRFFFIDFDTTTIKYFKNDKMEKCRQTINFNEIV